jgi:hypothetical protein
MSDILADYREWRDQQATRVSTHSGGCHMWHKDCMIHRLADALGRARLTDEEREAISRVYDLLCDRARELQSATRLDEARPLIQWAKTLQGLWERLSPDRPEAIAAGDTATPPEPAIPPAWLSRPYWVDPAGGHRYGFPRLYDPAKDGDMTEWLIANGYPESLAMQELACTFTACTDSGGK